MALKLEYVILTSHLKVLAAIVFGLGGSARTANRGNTNKGFIRCLPCVVLKSGIVYPSAGLDRRVPWLRLDLTTLVTVPTGYLHALFVVLSHFHQV